MRRTTLLFGAGALAGAAVHATASAVRAWRPGGGTRRRGGRLSVRIQEAAGGAAVVLLHGLPASGDGFGPAFDGVEGQLVVPDLLAAGHPRDAARGHRGRSATQTHVRTELLCTCSTITS